MRRGAEGLVRPRGKYPPPTVDASINPQSKSLEPPLRVFAVESLSTVPCDKIELYSVAVLPLQQQYQAATRCYLRLQEEKFFLEPRRRLHDEVLARKHALDRFQCRRALNKTH